MSSISSNASAPQCRSWNGVAGPSSRPAFDIELALMAMEKGHRALKVLINRKVDATSRYLRLHRLSGQILFCRTESGTGKAERLNLHSIKDVHSLEYRLNIIRASDRWRHKELLRYDASKVVIIYHGTQFVLQVVLVALETSEACSQWVRGLNVLRREGFNVPHPTLINRWLHKEFNAIVNPTTMTVHIKHMKPFVQQRLQCRISCRSLIELTNDSLDFEAFVNAYCRLTYNHALFSNSFYSYAVDGHTVTLERFEDFLRWEQKAVSSPPQRQADCPNFQEDVVNGDGDAGCVVLQRYLYGTDHGHRPDVQLYLTAQEFLDYLFSRENGLLQPRERHVNQDMQQPLCDYWISSSHNTYLTGDQLTSESSLEAYTRALLMNCRCIELDCWDGQKKSISEYEIVVYHGYTMTTKLNLRDILHTIRQYAFVASDYPLILSIEDNCSLPYQRQLANDLKDILKDMLVTAPLDCDATQLPSPEQLRRKILVKHKKLPLESEEKGSVANSPPSIVDDPFQDEFLSSADVQKKGVLCVKEKDSEQWKPYIFVLLSDRLYYCRCTYDNLADGLPNGNGSSEKSSKRSSEVTSFEENSILSNQEELHLTEEWFHGRISRDQAKEILEANSRLGRGLFLVRESTTFVGDYSLSLLHKGGVHHCRIKSTQVDGVKLYYLLDSHKMDTLYQLIAHYQRQPLATPKFRSRLKTACPQPCPHVGEPWFAGDIDKQKAEEMLNAYPMDGAFLIRSSSANGSGERMYILSFRVDGLIKHARLKHEGRLFLVGDHQFESLNWMVCYYGSHELFRGVCLKYPVNQETIERFSSEISSAPSGCYLDLNGVNGCKCVAKSLQAYVAKSDAELSFPANALILLYRQENDFWWKGSYRGHVGMIPADHIDFLPCNPNPLWNSRPSISSAGSQDVEVECLLLYHCTVSEVDASRPYSFRISEQTMPFQGRELIVSAASHDEAADWINSIMEMSRFIDGKPFSKDKCPRISKELSNLVVYCQAVPFDPDRVPGKFYEMCSFCDSKLDRLLDKGLARFNRYQLSRVYPNGTRLTSSNFNPVPMWNAGCQLVALNYQTPDKSMQLNQAKFVANGACGYVLKPDFMRKADFDPQRADEMSYSNSMLLTIEVVAGRHLYRKDKGKGIVSPVVEVEVIGLPGDCRSFRTSAVSSDGLHPMWNEHFEFSLKCPDLAFLRFYVVDGDLVYPTGESVIGQAAFPVNCIRSGYRSVILKNEFSEELELSALLLHVDIQPQNSIDNANLSPELLRAVQRLEMANNTNECRNNKAHCSKPTLSKASLKSMYSRSSTSSTSHTLSSTSSSTRRQKGSSALRKFFKLKMKPPVEEQ